MTPHRYEVLVAGAGPSGATAATSLARQGLPVLLVDPGLSAGPEAPATDAYDVLVTGPALRGLASIAVAPPAAARPADTIDIRFGPGARHTVDGAEALICDRGAFLRALRRAAADAGATPVPGRVTALTPVSGGHDVEITTPDGVRHVEARHVIVAVGATGGLTTPAHPHAYGTTAVQRFAGGPPPHHPILALPAPGPTRTETPSCVWALPAADGTVTIGTTRVGPALPAEHLLSTARETLARAGPGLTPLHPVSPPYAAPINTGFIPARAPGAAPAPAPLVAGEAAGLANPFTGEGFSYAVQSGLIAARVTGVNRGDPGIAYRRYGRRLAATFVGYFETARHANRRYHLAWRVLAAGAGSAHPFFAKGRRAILLPEGFDGLTAVERMDLLRGDAALFGPFLAACDEVAIATVRQEWPFLARLTGAGDRPGHQGLRPAIPFFAALYAGGTRPAIARARLGAAIELALLGTLALLGPAQATAPRRGVDWALTSTILAGDFLLAQASRLVSAAAPEVSWAFADWLGELAELRAGRLDPAGGVPAAAVFSALLEFPARVGAQLGGATPATVRALREFGRRCGEVFLHAEDVLALRGARTRLDTGLGVMLDGGFSGVPDALGEPVTVALLADPVVRARAVAAVAAAGDAARRRAVAALADVPVPAARRILAEFAATAAAPILACGDNREDSLHRPSTKN